MAEIIALRRATAGDGGGPGDPMLDERVAKLESDMSDIKASLVKIDAKLDKLDFGLNGKIAAIDGRLSGMDHRFAALPSTWTMLGIVFTTWALGSGILIFAMNFLKKP